METGKKQGALAVKKRYLYNAYERTRRKGNKEGEKGTMQQYETLMETLKPLQKSVKDGAAATVSAQKKIAKDVETGNLTEAKKLLAGLKETAANLIRQAEDMEETLNGFDVQDYFVSGDFTKQLLEACGSLGINVRGEKGVYEMFPYKIRVVGDAERQGEVWLDRKKVQSCRPVFVAETVKKGQEKLFAARFDAGVFISELAEAYEVYCLRNGQRTGTAQSLTKIYKSLVPMARSRKEYDMQAFALDLSRAYAEGPDAWVSKTTGKRYRFGTGREGSGIRVLSSTGVESYITTFSQINTEE